MTAGTDELDRRRKPAFDGPIEAVVHRVDGRGLYVRIQRSGQRYVHGPCRWARPTPATPAGDPTHDHGIDHDTPPVGTPCLVVRSDRRRWWVVAFAGWPA